MLSVITHAIPPQLVSSDIPERLLVFSDGDCGEAYTHGDTVARFAAAHGEGVAWWWQANQTQSVYTRSVKQQQLRADQLPPDPLSYITAGGAIVGVNGPLHTIKPTAGEVRNSTREGIYGSVSSTTAAMSFELLVVPHVSSGSRANFSAELQTLVAQAAKVDYNTSLQAHTATWARLWQRSWIIIEGGEGSEAYNVTQMAILGRYLDLSQGDGPFPIKWQGGLFHYDTPPTTNDIDTHGWGGAYWIWEARYPYYASTAAGDFDMATIWLEMYLSQLPLARARVEQIYGHAGAIFVETSYLWVCARRNLHVRRWDIADRLRVRRVLQ